jgi:hypothetical protein
MVERQLIWYMYSEPNPERHFWNILGINEERELGIIKQNLYRELAPIVEEKWMYKGPIKDSYLHYWLFCLETTAPKIDFSKVYQGKVKNDRRLIRRKTAEGWDDLIQKVYEGEI